MTTLLRFLSAPGLANRKVRWRDCSLSETNSLRKPAAVAVNNGPPECQVWGLKGSVMADNRRVRVVVGVILGAVVGCALGIAPILLWDLFDRSLDQGAFLVVVTGP